MWILKLERDFLQMILFMLVDTDEKRDKLEALIHRYENLMFYVINDIINDKYLSEDILQEVLIKIAKNIDRVDNDITSNSAKSFILTIARNTAFDYYRKNDILRSKECLVETFDEEAFYDFDEKIISKLESEDRIKEVTKGLKEKYRDVLILKYVHDYNEAEIAKILNITKDNVRKRLSRGKKLIEEKLKGMGKNDGRS